MIKKMTKPMRKLKNSLQSKSDSSIASQCPLHQSQLRQITGQPALNFRMVLRNIIAREPSAEMDRKNLVSESCMVIVFTPRVLDVKEMKKDSPRNGNLKFSNQSQDPDMSQFSALLNCKDAVFNTWCGKVAGDRVS